jgi:Ca-activated chloride channel homolog
MPKQYLLLLLLVTGFISGPAAWMAAQENKPNFHVVVDLVQLNVTVTDSKGKYVPGSDPRTF